MRVLVGDAGCEEILGVRDGVNELEDEMEKIVAGGDTGIGESVTLSWEEMGSEVTSS